MDGAISHSLFRLYHSLYCAFSLRLSPRHGRPGRTRCPKQYKISKWKFSKDLVLVYWYFMTRSFSNYNQIIGITYPVIDVAIQLFLNPLVLQIL